MTLEQIQNQTRRFADAHKALAEEVDTLNEMLEAAKRSRLHIIKAAVARAIEERAKLKVAIEAAPQFFEKPRTIILHGVKIGLQKGKGGIEFDDADKVVERIERIYGDAAVRYLHVRKTPNKDALTELTAAELKKLGCSIIEAGDEVVIKPVDSDVDKVVTALLKGAEKEAA